MIVDVNIILSALMKDSTSREIIIKSELDFCFPEVSLHKIEKYRGLILEKSGLTDEELNALLKMLFQCIRLIPAEGLMRYWDESMKIMEHIDTEDVPFIAAALSQQTSIWSEDRHFEKQKRIRYFKTEEVLEWCKKV